MATQTQILTTPTTNPTAQKFIFLWDTWENCFLIPFPCATEPPSWFTPADIDPDSQTNPMPPLDALSTYLHIFNHLSADNPELAPLIRGTTDNAGQLWRRIRPTEPAARGGLAQIEEEEEEAHEDIRCGVCHDKEVSIQFRECTHALCAGCNDKYWWSLISTDILQGRDPSTVLRLSFPCHMCRAEIYHERLITHASSSNTAAQEDNWYVAALRPGFGFHRLFVVRVEEDDRVKVEPLMGERERPQVSVDGEMVEDCWHLYLVYAMMMLVMTVDTLRADEAGVY